MEKNFFFILFFLSCSVYPTGSMFYLIIALRTVQLSVFSNVHAFLDLVINAVKKSPYNVLKNPD